MSTLDAAAQGTLKGVLAVERDELVSCDFQGNPNSCVVDSKACVELNSRVSDILITLFLCANMLQFFKVLAWYDNEWAYSSRLLDLVSLMADVDRQP